MAFSIQYKKLFEVEILHEYFLNEEGKASFFDLARGRSPRFERLKYYDVRDFMDIEPTKRCAKQLRNYRMVFKTTKTGFFVGVEVGEELSLDGRKQYRPTIEFDENIELDFRIIVSDEHFTRFSNSNLHRNLKAKYLFSIPSRRQDVQADDPLLLTLPTSEYLENKQYEPGDQVFILDGDTKINYQALVRTKSHPLSIPGAWMKIGKDYGFVSEDDAQIIPRYGSYRFNSVPPILKANFRLIDESGEKVWQYDFEDTETGRLQFGLNLSKRELEEAIVRERIKTGPYILEVEGDTLEGDGLFLDKRQVVLNDVLFNGGENQVNQKAASSFGMVKINLNPEIPAYHVLDEKGFLKTSNGVLQNPVYEIRFQSLQSKWVYSGRKIEGIEIDESRSSVNKITIGGREALITKEVLSLIQSGRKIKLVFNNEEAYYLPNPNGLNIILGENGQKYSEVLINSI